MSTELAKISEENALEEMRQFVGRYKKRELRQEILTDEHLLDQYPDAVYAVMDGFLVFDGDGKPKLTLREPLKTKEKNDSLSIKEITFKDRIKPSDQTRLMKGINIQTNAAMFALKMISYIIDQPIAVLDLMDKEDYATIQQICSVF